MIPAHDSPLAALAFDASGTKLATASEKVRLYSTPARRRLCGLFLSCFRFPPEQIHHRCRLCPLFIFHFLSGNSHSCLLDPGGTEAL